MYEVEVQYLKHSRCSKMLIPLKSANFLLVASTMCNACQVFAPQSQNCLCHL